jgi:hypothetical protein
MERKELTPALVDWFKWQKGEKTNRQIARNLLNALIKRRTGLSLDELPDSSILCDALDELEALIHSGTFEDLTIAYNEALYYASEIIDTIME